MNKPPSPPKPPSFSQIPFSEMHRPRHAQLEALEAIRTGTPAATMIPQFEGLVPPEQVEAGSPKNLLEAYGIGWERLIEDARLRPDHYTPRELEIIKSHDRGGMPLGSDPHYTELNELAVKLFEKTENRQERKKILEKVTKPTDPADDPMTVTEDQVGRMGWAEKQVTFENQNFPDDLKKFL